MSTLSQLSTIQEVDTSLGLALKFIPIIELRPDFSNFDRWEHSVRFYMHYHGLYGLMDEKMDIRPSININSLRRYRLYVYSVIWESAKAGLPRLEANDKWRTKLYGNHEHDPKVLLKVLHDYQVR